jgi:hypothetical protein
MTADSWSGRSAQKVLWNSSDLDELFGVAGRAGRIVRARLPSKPVEDRGEGCATFALVQENANCKTSPAVLGTADDYRFAVRMAD